MANRLFALLLAMFLGHAVQAKIQDLCRPGSDAECARYGENMCCAEVIYNYKDDRQRFHSCASRIGIEASGGRIRDEFGFSGTWKCNGAQATIATALALTLATLLSLF